VSLDEVLSRSEVVVIIIITKQASGTAKIDPLMVGAQLHRAHVDPWSSRPSIFVA